MSDKRFNGVYGKSHKILEKGRRDYDLLFAEDVQDIVDLLNALAEENERLRNHKKVLDEDNTDKYFQIRKQEQQIKKLQEINEELSEKIKELSFNDYKRCLEIINHQRTIINKIEKLTGQTIEELINLDKGVEME